MSKGDFKFVSKGYSNENESVLLEAKIPVNYKKYEQELKITKINNKTGKQETLLFSTNEMSSLLNLFAGSVESTRKECVHEYFEKYRKQNIEEGLDS